jgi:hypothetical protein
MIVVGVVKAIAPRFRNKMIKTRKVLAAIIEVEETHGDQGLWKGVHEARLRGVGYTLTPEQNAQLDDFKIKVFDGPIKKPLMHVSKFLNDEEIEAILDAVLGDDEDE